MLNPYSKGKSILTYEVQVGKLINRGKGHTLRIEADFTEYHPGTKHYYTDIDGESAFGNNTGVVYSRNSDVGYGYTEVDFYGFVDGVEYTRLPDVRP